MMSSTFMICCLLLSLYQIQYSFGQEEDQDPIEKENAAGNINFSLNVHPEVDSAMEEVPTEVPTETSTDISTEIPTEISMSDALNETDMFLFGNNTNNDTADEDEGNGSLTTFTPELIVTSTEPPLPTELPNGDLESEISVEDFCLCDLKIDFCDINCCCDADCDGEDRKVFSHCRERPQPVLDSKYCFQEHLIFSNHTEYSVEYTDTGAFCIITDNLPQRTTYKLVKGAANIEEYEVLKEKKRRYYSWLSNQGDKPATIEPYKDGTFIWGVDENGAAFPIGLPISVVGSECETVTSAFYLQDAETSCNQMLHDVALECESNMYLSAFQYLAFSVIADPRNLHQNKSTETTTGPETYAPTTTIEDIIEEESADASSNNNSVKISPQVSNNTDEGDDVKNYTVLPPGADVQKERQQRRLISFGKFSDFRELYQGQLVSVRTYLCQVESESEVCVEKNINDIPQPVYASGVCSNVLLSVDLIFIHNGTEGIYDVQAKVYLTNLSNVLFHTKQRFSVKYLWTSTEEETFFERSGRPGYIIGKPLMMGTLIENRTEDDVLKEAISVDMDPRQWLKILSPGSTGKCDSSSQVTFGVDMRAGCAFQITQDDFTHACELLQRGILRLLLGSIPLNDKLRIASFGDSSVNNPADWVPILVPEEPRCEMSSKLFGITRHHSFITSIHIEVAYSLQGSLANPQPKVIGVVLRYGEPQEIRFPCSNAVCLSEVKKMTQDVELISSVSFVDVTRPPLPAYSQPPALDVKLPYDFFYPFLPSSTSCLQMECINVCIILNIVCYILIIKKF